MRCTLLLGATALMWPAAALGQSGPNWPKGYIPRADEWQSLAISKLDMNGPSGATTTTPPGGGARGLSSRTQDIFNIRDFGAIGDGVTHPLSTTYATLVAAQAICPEATALTQETNWCAIQAATDKAAAKTYGAIIYAPAGRYLISSPVTATLTGAQAIMLAGDGLTATEILETNPTADGFDITIAANGTWLRDSSGAGPTFGQRALSLVKSSAGVGGTAVSISSSYGSAGLRQASAHDVGYRGDKFGGMWATGLNMVGIMQPDIVDIYCHAGTGGDTTSICASFAGNSAGDDVDVNFDNVRMAGGGDAISIGANVQGVYARRISATSAQHGIVWASGSAGAPDSLIVAESQLNTVQDAVFTDHVADVQVLGNLMFPLFGAFTPTLTAAVNVGDTGFSVSSVTSLRIGQGVVVTGFPASTLVTAISGSTISVSQAATAAIASSTAVQFNNSPNWIGVRVGNGNRFTVAGGNIFNGGGVLGQSAVQAISEAGGAITGNHAYLLPSTLGAFQLSGTTSTTAVVGNSCASCAVTGSDSNNAATGNFAADNVVNSQFVISGFGSRGGIFSIGNTGILVGGGNAVSFENSLGYPAILQGDGASTTQQAVIQGGSGGAAAKFACNLVAGTVVSSPNNCSAQLLGLGTGSALLGSTTTPTQVLGTMIVAQHTPASSTETCTAGQTADEGAYHYWCATAGQWLRVAGATW